MLCGCSNLDSRFRRTGSGSLHIGDVTEEDDGVYQCRAENTEDSGDVTATLQVQVPPRFIQRPQSVVANEKEDAELQCRIYGKPQPTIQWTKNGELIIESEYFQVHPPFSEQFPSSFRAMAPDLLLISRSFFQLLFRRCPHWVCDLRPLCHCSHPGFRRKSD